MRVIPVRETAFSGFSVVMEPEPKIADRDTGEVRKDQATGQTVWVVGLVAIRGRDSSVIQVSVVGEPSGLTLGVRVRVVDLDAMPWDRDGRSGVVYRAGSVVALGAAELPVAASASSSGAGRRVQPSASGPSAASSVPSGGEAH